MKEIYEGTLFRGRNLGPDRATSPSAPHCAFDISSLSGVWKPPASLKTSFARAHFWRVNRDLQQLLAQQGFHRDSGVH